MIEESLSVRMTEDFVKNFLENIERQNLKNENEKENSESSSRDRCSCSDSHYRHSHLQGKALRNA